jgi:L-asparaginase
MSQIALLTTGGTIAMRQDDAAGGAIPKLGAGDLRADLPVDLPSVIADEFCNLPSAHFTLELLWRLRGRVLETLARPEIAGIAITHGTDTLEESAYLLDLTIPDDKPVVLTGAMRTASEPGYEGQANLHAALRVAAAPEARGLGALVTLNDQIHAARHVTKTHTQSLDTFASPDWGPLGRIENGAVHIAQRVARDLIPTEHLDIRVALLRLAMGLEADALLDALSHRPRGLVIEGFGGGRVPPWWMPPIREAITQGTQVVIASRCPSGTVGDHYGYAGSCTDLQSAGALLSPGLSGQKARLRLMAALGASDDPVQVSRLFSGDAVKAS